MSPEPEKGPNFRYQQLVAPIALYPDALVPRYSPPPPTPEEIAGARAWPAIELRHGRSWVAMTVPPPHGRVGRPTRAARLSENLG